MRFLFYLLIFSFSVISSTTHAQRGVTYQSLLQRASLPNIYIDQVTLPNDDVTVNYSVIFRMDHDFVPFIKVRSDLEKPHPDIQFFSNVRMGLELFEGFHEDASSRRVRNLEAKHRASWQDTAWAYTFEETRSRTDYAQGLISVNINPGKYTYMLKLSRGESVREQDSRLRNVEIPDYSRQDTATIITLSEFNKNDKSIHASLLNFGQNVLYGEDFELLILNPQKKPGDKYKIELYKLLPGEDRKASDEMFYSVDIDSTYEFKGSGFSLSYKIDNVSLEFNLKEDGYPLSIVPIPNGRFPNSGFQIVLKNVTNDTTVTKKTVGSLWPDMPVSLLNLDVAIDMLRFIVSDSKLKEMKSGNAVEKEKKFREFWAERDPTPDTEFNELMVEYYDRIDYAYKEYTTPQNPGFNTDQGRAYILFGEPNDIERRLPTNAPTREIWYYDNRTLVFEATTGFGDFKLIGEQ